MEATGINHFDQLNPNTDLVIIAISDQSIADVIQKINHYLQQALIVHTSGSTSLEVLSTVHERSGVFFIPYKLLVMSVRLIGQKHLCLSRQFGTMTWSCSLH